MATEAPAGAPGVPETRTDEPRALPGPLVVLAAVALGAAAVGAMLDGDIALLVSAAVIIALGFSAWHLGFRSFTHFFVLACCVRPLIDLTAGPRSEGVALTEVFGIGVLAVMIGWLGLNRRVLATRLTTPLALSLGAMVLAYVLATFGSLQPVEGVSATLRIVAGVAVFLVTDLLLVTRRLSLRQLLQLVFLVSVVPLTYPVLGVVGVPVSHEKDGIIALKSVFFLSNNLGHFLVPLLVLGTAWVLRSRGWWRLAALGYTAVVGVELLLSQTRGAWIGAAVGVLVVCVVLDRRTALLGALGLVAVALLVPAVNSRITDLAPDPDDPYSESSFAWRLDQWDRLMPEVGVSPVTGGGPGTSVRLTGKEPHNDYLKAGLETGAVGFAAYLGFLGASVVTAWRAHLRIRRLRRSSPGSVASQPLVEAAFAAIAAYSVAVMFGAAGENLIDNVTFLWATLPLFAIAQWAITAPADRLRLDEETETVA